ncbi:flavin reductase family protein [Nocardia sp. NPDC050793]|uniref:flavin reductase family protein n=1 Tax=Nocardia sp. NPDC050793 TaxID=3155159 RepID=UPI003409ECA2
MLTEGTADAERLRARPRRLRRARCEWTEGPHGLPILSAAPYWFTGRILARYDFGDHIGVVMEPTAGHAADSARPALRTGAVADLPPGHEA